MEHLVSQDTNSRAAHTLAGGHLLDDEENVKRLLRKGATPPPWGLEEWSSLSYCPLRRERTPRVPIVGFPR
jgi:hypothetical protein